MILLLQLFAVLRDLLTDKFQAIFKVCEGNCGQKFENTLKCSPESESTRITFESSVLQLN